MSQVESNTPALVGYATVSAGMSASFDDKKVHKFARLGWNGKALHVQAHGAIPTSQVDLGSKAPAIIEPFFVIVNKITDTINIWVPSVSDLQAKDWYLVE